MAPEVSAILSSTAPTLVSLAYRWLLACRIQNEVEGWGATAVLQVLQGTGHGVAVDWWSFGTLIFEMLVGTPPFYSRNLQTMYRCTT